MKIKDIMKSVEPLPPDATVADAAQVMKEQEVGIVPVGNEEQIEGVVTTRTIALATATERCNPEQMPVDTVLHNVMGFCWEGEELAGALRTMQASGCSRVLVRDSIGRTVGVVSIEDVLAASPELQNFFSGNGHGDGDGNGQTESAPGRKS